MKYIATYNVQKGVWCTTDVQEWDGRVQRLPVDLRPFDILEAGDMGDARAQAGMNLKYRFSHVRVPGKFTVDYVKADIASHLFSWGGTWVLYRTWLILCDLESVVGQSVKTATATVKQTHRSRSIQVKCTHGEIQHSEQRHSLVHTQWGVWRLAGHFDSISKRWVLSVCNY